MENSISPENMNRMARIMIEKFGMTYTDAVTKLSELRLQIECGPSIKHSPSLQAAFITALTTGNRAFHGGISYSLPANIPLLLPWPGHKTLNTLALELLPNQSMPTARTLPTLCIDRPDLAGGNFFHLYCDGWRAGISPKSALQEFSQGADFSLGGVAAGALGVGVAFFGAVGISTRANDKAFGISLWELDNDWLSNDSIGPKLESLPKKLWLLGLGHLGQAFLWNMCLLPFENPASTELILQDFDKVVKANWTAGLICDGNSIGRFKTRVSADFLEKRGFLTRIVERPFDGRTIREPEEPRIAICGFDKAEPRRILDKAGFDLVVESGVGGGLDSFDKIGLHTLPHPSMSAETIWDNIKIPVPAINPILLKQLDQGSTCGVLAEELAQTSISTSFVGALAGALSLSEILRAYHNGSKLENFKGQIRYFESRQQYFLEPYSPEIAAKNGTVPAH